MRRPEPSAASQQVIGRAIQDLMAARLGRGFIPLGILFAAGALEIVRSTGGFASWTLALGALASTGAILAYGYRISQRAFGRESRVWMALAGYGSVVPPFFALYLIGWRGLRLMAPGGGFAGFALAILFALLGVWVLHCWVKVAELERLARIMTLNLDGEGGSA